MLRNASPAVLYEHAIAKERAAILSCGVRRRIRRRPAEVRSTNGLSGLGKRCGSLVGSVNIPVGEASFLACRQAALDILGARPVVYVVDGFAGRDGIPAQGSSGVRPGLSWCSSCTTC